MFKEENILKYENNFEIEDKKYYIETTITEMESYAKIA